MKRTPLLAPEHFTKAYYHCVSRVANREFMPQEEKEQFITLMRLYELRKISREKFGEA